MDYLTYRWTTHGILFYTAYISVDLAHQVIFHAKVGKGGINTRTCFAAESGLFKKECITNNNIALNYANFKHWDTNIQISILYVLLSVSSIS